MVNDETGFTSDLETKIHQTIKKVSSDYETLKYNTAIAAMMELVNEFYKKGSVTKTEFGTLLTLLNPVAPHITEELWEEYGTGGYLYEQSWTEFDESKTKESVIEIGVQVNGKVRGTVALPVDISKEEALAKGKEAVADKLEGKQIVKEIYVPGRILNIVVK